MTPQGAAAEMKGREIDWGMVMDCGCIIATVGTDFVAVPCGPSCPVWTEVQRLTIQAGHPVEFRFPTK